MTTPIPNPRTREAIASRFRAGDSVAELAHDYEQPTEAIEAAIREDRLAAESAEILNSNILALIELLTYDGVKTRSEGSVLVGEKLDEYRERTVLNIPTHIDADTLEELDDGERDATPGPWEWWTSNSWRRLSGPNGKDGGVLCPDNHPVDRHPDLRVSQEDMWLIENLRNSARALIDEAKASFAFRELLENQVKACNQLQLENQRLRRELAASRSQTDAACEMADQAMVEVCRG